MAEAARVTSICEKGYSSQGSLEQQELARARQFAFVAQIEIARSALVIYANPERGLMDPGPSAQNVQS